MMFKGLLLIPLVVTHHAALGFTAPLANQRMMVSTKFYNAQQSKGMPFEPMPDFDVERARDCAENFGKCTIQELETLKDGLHKERVEHYLMDSIAVPNHFEPEAEIEHRLLEEDLAVQLSLLKDEMPKSTLFPDVKADDPLPFPDHPEEKILQPRDTTIEPQLASLISKNPFIFEESVDEAVVLCAVVLALVAFPFILPN